MRGFRHAFSPQAHDPSRCRYCLHKLDCAPHLPLTPRATYPESGLVRHIDRSRRSQLHEAGWWPVQETRCAAVQGER